MSNLEKLGKAVEEFLKRTTHKNSRLLKNQLSPYVEDVEQVNHEVVELMYSTLMANFQLFLSRQPTSDAAEFGTSHLDKMEEAWTTELDRSAFFSFILGEIKKIGEGLHPFYMSRLSKNPEIRLVFSQLLHFILDSIINTSFFPEADPQDLDHRLSIWTQQNEAANVVMRKLLLIPKFTNAYRDILNRNTSVKAALVLSIAKQLGDSSEIEEASLSYRQALAEYLEENLQ